MDIQTKNSHPPSSLVTVCAVLILREEDDLWIMCFGYLVDTLAMNVVFEAWGQRWMSLPIGRRRGCVWKYSLAARQWLRGFYYYYSFLHLLLENGGTLNDMLSVLLSVASLSQNATLFSNMVLLHPDVLFRVIIEGEKSIRGIIRDFSMQAFMFGPPQITKQGPLSLMPSSASNSLTSYTNQLGVGHYSRSQE